MSAVIVVVLAVVRCAHTCGSGTRHEVAWLLVAAISIGVAGAGGLLVMSAVDAIRDWRRR